MSVHSGSHAKCPYDECNEVAWSESSQGFCIYHSPQEKDSNTAAKVWEKARDMAKREQHPDFRGWHFPRDPAGRWFISVVFKHEPDPGTAQALAADFGVSEFPSFPNFTGAVFHESVSFAVARFTGKPLFLDATFKGQALFRGTRFDDASSFDRARFMGEAVFHQAKFSYSATFIDVLFEGKADFSHALFVTAANFSASELQGTRFCEEASFEWAEIRRSARFDGAVFQKTANFKDAMFGADAGFKGAQFAGNVDFHGATFSAGKSIRFDVPTKGRRPFSELAKGADCAYRFAKQAARARGNPGRADWYGYWEWRAKIASRHRVRRWWHALQIPVRWSFIEFSHHPWLLVLLSAITILAFASYYHLSAAIGPSSLCTEQLTEHVASLADCLHFSAVTFTTLGYGDLVPKPRCSRYVCDAEAGAGAVFMALLVVMLARKYLP